MDVELDSFFRLKNIGLIGASNKKGRFGNSVFNALVNRKINVYPINQKYSEINGKICYNDIASIPNKLDGIIIILSKKNTIKILKESIELDIKNIWVQQGSESKEAFEIARKSAANIIFNKCVLMYAEPLEGFHKFHRTIKKIFSRL